MRPPINPVFNNSKIDAEWLQEYFVQGEDLADFLKFLGRILQKNNVTLFNASVRFVKQDPLTKLSYAHDGDRYAVVLFFNQKLLPKEIEKTKTWVREVIDYLIAHKGTYYLPYQHFATLEQFRACYPNWESIRSYKQTVDTTSLFDNGFISEYLMVDVCQDSLFRAVFDRVNGQRAEVSDFLNNIFMQLNEKEFFILIDSILENPQLTDEQIYAKLYKKISQTKPNAISTLKRILRSLTSLKEDLGDQSFQLIGQRKIDGYVEIGYPGRMIRPLKNRLNMQGPLYAIADNESINDYVEAGFPRPYDRFISLNDYEPISEEALPNESVDFVAMYIGLHHIPHEKLAPFVASIKRILRPGGIFILMDHDAHTTSLQNLVDVVHSIFNAATGVSPETNAKEIRNFQSLNHWINYVKSHGLIHYEHPPLVRQGDSTINSLVRFDKPSKVPTRDEIIETVRSQPDYQRPQIQTYLTAPEWQNVRAAQRYADFVEAHPSFQYPYFEEVKGFWKVYWQSMKAAQKQNGFGQAVFSDYNLMNFFVGTTMTLEYGAKGLIATPFSLISKTPHTKNSEEQIPTDQERLRSLKEYGKFIENTPFYHYPYFRDIGRYWNIYLKEQQPFMSRVKGTFSGIGMTLEYGLKGLISAPLSCIYGSDAIKESETTHLLVHDPENHIELIDPSIVIRDSYSEHGIKHIEVPRYMYFTEILLKIAQEPSIQCINIAGHDKIQMDIKSPEPIPPPYFGAQKLYNIPNSTDLESTYIALEVNVAQLCEVIRSLNKDNVEVLFIHDY